MMGGEGGTRMIDVLNLAVEAVESQLATETSVGVRVADVAARSRTTEHHQRRMFATVAGMPLSE
jgi:AraC family transcriptional regulator